MKPNKVFVYGSLRKGHGNHAVLDHDSVSFDCNAEINGFAMYSLGAFPGCVAVNSNQPVYGEVYTVDDDNVWQALDALEGHPSFYERHVVTTRKGDDVWIYLLDHATVKGREEVKGGDWNEFRKMGTL